MISIWKIFIEYSEKTIAAKLDKELGSETNSNQNDYELLYFENETGT